MNSLSFDFQTLIFFVLSQFLKLFMSLRTTVKPLLMATSRQQPIFWPSRQSMCTLTLFKPLYSGHMHLSTMALATKAHP